MITVMKQPDRALALQFDGSQQSLNHIRTEAGRMGRLNEDEGTFYVYVPSRRGFVQITKDDWLVVENSEFHVFSDAEFSRRYFIPQQPPEATT